MRVPVIALILSLSALAFADTLDTLGQALLRERSYRVRAQAAIVLGKLKDPRGVPLLIKALGDREAAVRAVAASSLGKLRDPDALEGLASLINDPSILVRSAAAKAVGAIENDSDQEPPIVDLPKLPPGSRRFSIELTPMPVNKGDAEMAKRVHEEVATHLAELPNVILTPEPDVPRFFVDMSISKMTTGSAPASGNLTINCELSVIIASHPGHAITAMATLSSSIEEQGGRSSDVAAAQYYCLGELAKQATEKVQTYLKGVQ